MVRWKRGIVCLWERKAHIYIFEKELRSSSFRNGTLILIIKQYENRSNLAKMFGCKCVFYYVTSNYGRYFK